jgi:hypothetical protein
MPAVMTATLDTPPPASAEEKPYHVRTSISQDAKKELFRLRSSWEAITGENLALPTVTARVIELVLGRPELMREILDEVREQHGGK